MKIKEENLMNFLPVVLSGTGGNAIFILIAYVVVFAILMYFLSVRLLEEQ